MAKPMFIETEFRPGDKVQYGPHDAHVQVLNVSATGVTYTVSYWIEDEPIMGTAFGWELHLLEALGV